MKIHQVAHSLSALKCSKCGTAIRPSRDETQMDKHPKTGRERTRTVRVLGDPYRWTKFNRRARTVRCMASACAFRRGELTTSEKMGRVYDAQDAASDAVSKWDGIATDDTGDLGQALADLASELREVAQEYNDSADAMENAFTGGSPTIDDCREKAESLEEWADELEGVGFDEWDADGHESEDDAAQAREAWAEEQRDKATEAIDNCPL